LPGAPKLAVNDIMTRALSTQSQELAELEAKLDRLIESHRAVNLANKELNRQLFDLKEEKSLLLEKAELAKTRVEALIIRLKLLEQNS